MIQCGIGCSTMQRSKTNTLSTDDPMSVRCHPSHLQRRAISSSALFSNISHVDHHAQSSVFLQDNVALHMRSIRWHSCALGHGGKCGIPLFT